MNYPDSYRNLSEHERQMTWNKIQGSISLTPQSTPSPYEIQSHIKKPLFSRDYAVAILCVLFLSSTTSVAAAADHSLPTSVLYSIKLNVTEPLRTLTKTTPEARIDWEIERTSRRLDETRQLIEQGTLTTEIAEQISVNIEQHTQVAQEKIVELSHSNSNQSTMLSLSLVETIEKKKEEILISTEQLTVEPANNPSAVATTQITATSEPSPLPLATQITPAPSESNQTESVISIIATADKAQQSTGTIIENINAQNTLLASISSSQSPKAEPVTADPNVITYTLVMHDIDEQITKLKELLDLPEEQNITPTETIIETASDTDAPPSVIIEPTADTADTIVSIPETTTQIIPPAADTPTVTELLDSVALRVSEPVLDTTLATEPAPPTEPQQAPLGIEPSEISTEVIPTVAEVVSTGEESSAPATTEDVPPASDKTFEEIVAEYSRLQTITQPTSDDIDTARSLRRMAETYIASIKIKQKKATASKDTSSNSNNEVLPEIFVQSLPLKIEQEDTANTNTTIKPEEITSSVTSTELTPATQPDIVTKENKPVQ